MRKCGSILICFQRGRKVYSKKSWRKEQKLDILFWRKEHNAWYKHWRKVYLWYDDIGNLNLFFLRLQAETGIALYEHASLIILDAPSGCNKQTTSLIAVDNPDVLKKEHGLIHTIRVTDNFQFNKQRSRLCLLEKWQ